MGGGGRIILCRSKIFELNQKKIILVLKVTIYTFCIPLFFLLSFQEVDANTLLESIPESLFSMEQDDGTADTVITIYVENV